MEYLPDIEVELTFLTAEEGGRKTPAFSGYRPQFYYDGNDWDAEHNYPDIEAVYPGQTVTAQLIFAAPHYHVGKLYSGKEFLIREGQKIVGKGIVTKILDLENSAERAKEKESK